MLSDKYKELSRSLRFWILAGAIALFLLGYWAGTGGGGHAPDGDGHVHREAAAHMWTCSMHPQIKKPGSGDCPICGMDLIPVQTQTEEELGPRQLKLTPAAVKLAEIAVTPVQRRSMAGSLRMVGKVDVDETSVRRISAWMPGRIERLFVTFTGASVKRGQPLVSIYSPDLVVAQEELRQARLALRQEGGDVSSKVGEVARRTIDAVKEKLRLWGLSAQQVEVLVNSQEPRDRLVIPSPTGGVVIGKDAVEGMYVKAGTPIYTVADLSTVWVKIDGYEADLKWLRRGQTVKFEVEAFPGEVFVGTVAFIDPVINAATRTAKVRVNVPNPAGKLKPEMFVTALVEPSVSRDHGEGSPPMVIPASAPLLTGTRAVVYVAVDRANGIYEGRVVELGGRAGDYYIVKSGLAEGDLVVVNGAFKLDSDLQIRGKPSMMNPGVETAKEDVAAHDDSHVHSDDAGEPIPKAFSASIQRLLDSYLEVQGALAGDDEAGARDRLKGVASAIEGVEMKYAKPLMDVVKRMNDSQSIDEFRTLFADLSVAVIDSVKRFGGPLEKTIYRFHCPMALNDKGAYWLQDHPEPRNPYFGASMLICHDLKEEWKPGRQ